MNILLIGALFCLVTMSFGVHLEQRKKRSDTEYFVSYISSSLEKGQMMTTQNKHKESQKIKIQDKEVRFVTDGGMSVVLDYDKMLMTIKNLPGAKYCGTLAFDEELVPVTYQQIIDALKNTKNEFKLPNKKMSLNLKKVKNADLPELSPLSADLCKGVEVYMLEPKREVHNTVKALSLRRRLRPKREVGVGEVILIVIVIIILL